MSSHPSHLLEVHNLRVRFDTQDGEVEAVNGVTFSLGAGETLGIVGESGSGKSQTVLAITGLLAGNGRASGKVVLQGRDLLTMRPRELNTVRGNSIGMVFQDPMTSLNPYLRISTQLTESLMIHRGMSRADALARAIEVLDAVHIPDAKNRVHYYPHEFSGGMRQRVMIAMALLCKPQLIIADEPTTALDVTVQAQILRLLDELKRDFGVAIILITHDLGVVAGLCDKVMVMYGGQVMEANTLDAIFATPQHPYTRGLLRSVPRLDTAGETRLQTIPGNPPDLMHLPVGCPFSPRCPDVESRCQSERPMLRYQEDDSARACHRAIEELS
ncbi:MAG: oligopeptide/dipeptide ABC transporter ATP-binding protein [Oceanococcaceae bacterium]